jgi:hypothetical protein
MLFMRVRPVNVSGGAKETRMKHRALARSFSMLRWTSARRSEAVAGIKFENPDPDYSDSALIEPLKDIHTAGQEGVFTRPYQPDLFRNNR